MDNAIEYLESHKECRPQIEMDMICGKGILTTNIRNEVSEIPEITNNNIKTTKSAEGHGYGLKSIKYIVDKYEGIMNLRLSDNTYTLELVLYNIQVDRD